ncbi:MAG: uroporphyrinogen decarboxylase family protein [Bacillota bacterium]
MKPGERAAAALDLDIPDMVPTFELEFQLEEKMFGKKFLRQEKLEGKSNKEKDKLIIENAEYMIEVFSELEYSIIPIQYLNQENIKKTARHIRKLTGDKYMLTVHGDGTFSIPGGEDMLDFVYRLSDEPDQVKREAEAMAEKAIARNKEMVDAGVDSFILCADYCFNDGPFLSPDMFAEFVQPYLHKIIEAIRADGAYAIKHTDGDIMPILDQLVACKPHALHSLDPMAGVDIKEVKEKVGDKVCLCGNVNCALLQTGTDEEVTASAEYCLKHGKPGGGYIYCTSNVPFEQMDPERYKLVLEIWKKWRDYE